MIMGLAGVSATMQEMLRRGLDRRLVALGLGLHKRGRILQKAVSDIGYVQNGTGTVGKAVLEAYVEGIAWTHGESDSSFASDLVTDRFWSVHANRFQWFLLGRLSLHSSAR
jgi:hypothetical protein